jgi:hypothetical protein
MDQANRLWLELENGADGPCGVVRDETGRSAAFAGWLELIAAIETPPWMRSQAAPADAPQEREIETPPATAMTVDRDTPAVHDRAPLPPSQRKQGQAPS